MSAQPQDDANYVTIEIDGVETRARKGSMIIEATDALGIDIPRFCYHKKLTIAANCRMCLVDVEKAPKPLPACATPVTDGMKVFTESRRAVDAQHGVMEFLLINHPLDCPICDQGGECELQDLAMGYGRSVSRFTERKRVVKDKNVGPLIKTDMTRCIHCTRCVRFLDEIAGTNEMGGTGRADYLEITTGVERGIVSELSGNIIDLCPVGALTNKPFRYSARAWELIARPAIAAHDGLGSSLHYHVRQGRIMRAVPRENDAVNETWLADRDRYSHFGLYAADRVLTPMVKRDGEWERADWDTAIEAAAGALRGAVDANGGDALGVLMSPSATDEEYFLAQRLARGLGSHNIDHRLRETDFRDDAANRGAGFEMGLRALGGADAVLLVGCHVRNEAPILGHRVRQAQQSGATVGAINPFDWNLHFHVQHPSFVPPQKMVGALAAVLAETEGGLPKALSALKDKEADRDSAKALAKMLSGAERGVIVLGQAAASHAEAAALRQLARALAKATGAALNVLPHGGNPAGAWRCGAVPHRGPGGEAIDSPGRDATGMLAEPRSTYLLWGFEHDFDTADPARAEAAMAAADHVVAVVSFATDALMAHADVILPLAPLAESEGTLTRLDGERVAFQAAGKAAGDVKPGWKILRRLGAALALDGFDQPGLDVIRAELAEALDGEPQQAGDVALEPQARDNGLHRIGEVPMYSVDALCRRAACLQQTPQAQHRHVVLNPADADRLGLSDGGKARVRQGDAHAELPVKLSERVPTGAAWVPAATCETRVLGAANGLVSVEVA